MPKNGPKSEDLTRCAFPIRRPLDHIQSLHHKDLGVVVSVHYIRIKIYSQARNNNDYGIGVGCKVEVDEVVESQGPE